MIKMAGGLIQLVAYGAQDVHLTDNPQISFLKIVYRRHTNFAIESIKQQSINGNFNWGNSITCKLTRNGDLVHKIYLEVELSALSSTTETDTIFVSADRYVNYIGHRLLRSVDIEIGGQKIDKHYSHWMYIWNELSLPMGKRDGYLEMVGAYSDLTSFKDNKIYIPLEFWFCRNIGLALPLIALQYSEIKLNIEIETFRNCTYHGTAYKHEDIVQNYKPIKSGTIWCDYILLDTDERRRFAQLSHEYLIEQLQFNEKELTNDNEQNINIVMNHPVKELIWTVNDIDSISDINQWYNYTDVLTTKEEPPPPPPPASPILIPPPLRTELPKAPISESSESSESFEPVVIETYLYDAGSGNTVDGQTSYTFTLTETTVCDILIVAGGGGGGSSYYDGNEDSVNNLTRIGGGGAGGVIFLKDQVIPAGDYTVKVGKGGNGAVYRSDANPQQGNDAEQEKDGKDSSFGNTVAYGGGGGGSYTDSSYGDGSGNRGGSAGGSAQGNIDITLPKGFTKEIPGPIKHWSKDENLVESYRQGYRANQTSLEGGGGAGGVGGISITTTGGISITTTASGIGRYTENGIDFKEHFKITDTNTNIGEHKDSKVYFGGGGGNGENKVSRGGLGGGGGNSVVTGTSAWAKDNIDGKPHTGGGGSGAVSVDTTSGGITTIKGGNGGSGIVIIRKNMQSPRVRESVIFNSVNLYEYRITKYLYNNHDQDTDTDGNPTGQTTYTFTLTETTVCDILIVAGGGGGGSSYYDGNEDSVNNLTRIGGGGAGGVIFLKDQVIPAGDYTVKVGKGGDGAIYREDGAQVNDNWTRW